MARAAPDLVRPQYWLGRDRTRGFGSAETVDVRHSYSRYHWRARSFELTAVAAGGGWIDWNLVNVYDQTEPAWT